MSLNDFADAIGIGRQTLVRIENGSRAPKPHEYEAMAETSGLPVAFFLVDDLDVVLDGHRDPTLADRVGELERQITELRAGLVALSADSLRRERERQERDGKGRPQERPGEGG